MTNRVIKLIFLSLCLALSAPSLAAEPLAFGKITFIKGDPSIARGGDETKFSPLAFGAVVREGDIVVTNEQGLLEITFPDGSMVRLAPNSRLRIDKAQFEQKKGDRAFSARLLLGSIWAKVAKTLSQNFEVTTANAVIGVRGTVFRVDSSNSGGADVTVYDGTVCVGRMRGSCAETVSTRMAVSISPQGEIGKPREAEKKRDDFTQVNEERDAAEREDHESKKDGGKSDESTDGDSAEHRAELRAEKETHVEIEIEEPTDLPSVDVTESTSILPPVARPPPASPVE